ncbi:plasmid mobilization protein MobA [Erwinia tasmaniensis]|uniref:Relaxase/mobilization protein n=1 Tax=Erwinia tasmaniensis (strain DSM 17950 / CFBP 7177 / CIP 109463 / NCPPB 4357 / Et1/99) TaxID=465817 RepID=B2VB51_ERWT9|nr:plasmid mobilization protein MobA [Erwinia tasmaniensis]CAO95039.1 Putative relaxase/mobilization protein [Erwinia tasmaniensis Et1/99]
MAKSEKRQRNALIQLRCTDAEADAIKKKAIAAGMTTSEYLRRTALKRRIMVRTDIRMMKELLRLGGLQKHLYTQMQQSMTTELSHQFSEVLTSIKHAINELDMTPVPAEDLKS